MNKTYKKHKFTAKHTTKKHVLDINLKGFFCSCNTGNAREKDCVREAYNLLNKYADILYPPPPTADAEDTKAGDIVDDLEKELAELRKTKDARRFQVVDSGAKNVIFIKTTLDNPVQLAEKIVSDIAETKIKQSRTLLRLVPIEITCKAYVKDIENAFRQIASKHFTDDTKTFSIIYNHRNNNNLKRDDVIKTVASVVSQLGPFQVNLKQAEISIVIEVIKGIALIGIVPNFIKYKKYNLHAITEQSEELAEPKLPKNSSQLSETPEQIPALSSDG
ncbi:hypothetical protein NQ315_000806 [Exocentrus adspersus]|uniref:THUMP domain-containing protein n=1 Tax=Exocentrus adspersus TaxID=1586481 RepID=A0AAV8WD77_9CUCU|nr:hypothetical protein NQ315_000806 [Exocentrus adspersus]